MADSIPGFGDAAADGEDTRSRMGRFGPKLVLILVVLVLATAAVAAIRGPQVDDSDNDSLAGEAEALDAALMDAAWTFTIDEDWGVERISFSGRGIALRMGPDLNDSGTWIVLGVRPASSLLPGQSQRDRYIEELASTVADSDQSIVAGPSEVQVSGVDGLQVEVAGLKGEKTGQPLGGLILALFENGCDYWLMAQWELADEGDMHRRFDEILKMLRLPDSCVDRPA